MIERGTQPPRYCVLGSIEARGPGGNPVALRGRTQRALLPGLLLHAPRAAPADRLVDLGPTEQRFRAVDEAIRFFDRQSP